MPFSAARASDVIHGDHRFAKLVLQGVNQSGQFGALGSQGGYNVGVCHYAWIHHRMRWHPPQLSCKCYLMPVMYDDLVARLREFEGSDDLGNGDFTVLAQAADAIERLQAELAEARGRQFYIDCEFDGHDGPLLSLALVTDDGDGIHIKTTAAVADEWVRANVLPLMDQHNAPKSASVGLNDVGLVIRAFIGECACPVIIADSPVDIGRFCRALSTGSDGGWASADYPAMRFVVHNVDCWPNDIPGAVQHNAWWDAMALRHKLAAIRERT